MPPLPTPSAARIAQLVASPEHLPVLSDAVAYKGWRNVIKRTVQFPNGKPVTFDITTAPPAVLVLPWCSQTKTVTLLREYCPGLNDKHMYTLVAGLFEEKHATIEDCIRWETEEEAQLRGGRLVPVMDSADRTLPGAKYTAQKFIPYIVMDAEKVSDSRPLDDDEIIQPVHGVSVNEALWLIMNGRMTSTSTMMVLLALEKLRQMDAL